MIEDLPINDVCGLRNDAVTILQLQINEDYLAEFSVTQRAYFGDKKRIVATIFTLFYNYLGIYREHHR